MTPALSFQVACDTWLSAHTPYIKPRTLKDYRQYICPLVAFFGADPLASITIERLREYQAWRSKLLNGPGPASKFAHSARNTRIKNEINSVLKPILREAGLWEQIKAKKFKHLPVSRVGSGQSLTPEEVRKLLELAFSNAKWKTCAHCLRIMFNTGCGFGEIRHLRRQDIDLEEGILQVSEEGAKNEARIRRIPLTPEALESVLYLLKRWEKLGGSDPSGYLLPFRSGSKAAKFSVPMATINGAWMAIRAAAVPIIGEKMKKFRIYDCRVTAITWVLSSGKISLLTAERLFGHISIQMQRRYFKPDLSVLRDAVNVLRGDAA